MQDCPANARTIAPVLLDLTQNPPRNVGPAQFDVFSGLVGYSHVFTPEWSSYTLGGVTDNLWAKVRLPVGDGYVAKPLITV